ncbi:hypothetical protein ABGB12_22060 [Actinocorallia sp. B10E7]|uniref:hypothetical protein n=1 Tax=Actinocorallia sp. B10E7 TaxID=3153558 RepID=UPI00325CC851
MNPPFPGLYMRPNRHSRGTVPAGKPYCVCPDIWPSGTRPIPDYLKTLAEADGHHGYKQESRDDIALHRDNYIYVRAKNGASTTQNKFAKLYYATNGIIQWPSMWQNNVLHTDEGSPQADLGAVPPGAVGVAERPFVWHDVPAPSSGRHYCLIAQIDDSTDSNPFPEVTSPLDLARLVQRDLGWGWRNVRTVKSSTATWQQTVPLDIAQNVDTEHCYNVYVRPVGYEGWSVSFSCSQVDDRGRQIQLPQTRIEKSGEPLGVEAWLAPGFTSMLTVYMYNTKHKRPVSGAHVEVGAALVPRPGAELDAAISAGVIDWDLSRRLSAHGPTRTGTEPSPLAPLGSYTLGS